MKLSCVSQLFQLLVTVTKYVTQTTSRGKVCVSSWFDRFQIMVIWVQAKNIQQKGVTRESYSPHGTQEAERNKSKCLGTSYSPQRRTKPPRSFLWTDLLLRLYFLFPSPPNNIIKLSFNSWINSLLKLEPSWSVASLKPPGNKPLTYWAFWGNVMDPNIAFIGVFWASIFTVHLCYSGMIMLQVLGGFSHWTEWVFANLKAEAK